MQDLIRAIDSYMRLDATGRAEYRHDFLRRSLPDPGIDRAIEEGIAWIGRAQDCSRSHDGGVAARFSLDIGWEASYPETTGYIVPTMLEYARLRGDTSVRERAQRMIDWLVCIQFQDGSFQGGLIDSKPVVSTTFNTGQILHGLVSAVREFGPPYREPMRRAADWLVQAQDRDGCWRKYPTPFAKPGEKTYDTHAAWALLEAARIEPGTSYADAGLANVRWALTWQQENGWFDRCSLSDPRRPLTHTLGYALRGILEAYRFTNQPALLQACRKMADGLLAATRTDGFLPGALDRYWRGAASWACLTGSVQIACCWLLLYQLTGEARYRDAGYAANRFVRRTMKVGGVPAGIRGGIKGSWPVYGRYSTNAYPSWACKFCIDSNLLERAVRARGPNA